MPISRHLVRSMANHHNCLRRSNRFAASLFRFSRGHGISEIALIVDRPIQGAPLPMHFQVGFIDVPAGPYLFMSPCSYPFRAQRSEPHYISRFRVCTERGAQPICTLL